MTDEPAFEWRCPKCDATLIFRQSMEREAIGLHNRHFHRPCDEDKRNAKDGGERAGDKNVHGTAP